MGEGVCVCSAAQSCPALCDPMDCSPLGSSVHEILQARTLDWAAMPPPGDLPMYDVKNKTFIFKFKKKEELGKKMRVTKSSAHE